MKLIVNADDCGISPSVNAAIKDAIDKGIVTSTTVMANMDAVDGAVELYREYGDRVSFGMHGNLSEGKPLTRSQCLLDNGFFVERNNQIEFFGKQYDYRRLTKEMKSAIRAELEAQMLLLLDNGICVSHIDSHQFVAFHREIISTFCAVARKYHIRKMRRRVTVVNACTIDGMKTYMYHLLLRLHLPTWKPTDFFMSGSQFMRMKEIGMLPLNTNKTCELMVHPGHKSEDLQEEMKNQYLLADELQHAPFYLISYNDRF